MFNVNIDASNRPLPFPWRPPPKRAVAVLKDQFATFTEDEHIPEPICGHVHSYLTSAQAANHAARALGVWISKCNERNVSWKD